MKHNYCLYLQYDGTKFNGWQKQGNTKNTIQELLERKLSEYTDEVVELKGSGRTDRGVHAKGQTANFLVQKELSKEKLMKWLNNELPLDIRVWDVLEVAKTFHSRKSAVKKTYEYCIFNSEDKDVFYHNYSYQVVEKLDMQKMKEAASKLTGTHDFLGFSSLKSTKKSTVRTLEQIEFEEKGKRIFIRYTGDGFLYHMVRILTGTLLEIGKGTMEIVTVENVLENKDRSLAGPTVPAQGLTLEQVFYDVENSSSLFLHTVSFLVENEIK